MLRLIQILLLAGLSACFSSDPQTQENQEINQIIQEQEPEAADAEVPDEEPEGIKGIDFFQGTVTRAFSLCKRCHADPAIPIEGERGPLTIFEYEAMLAMLDNNTLLPMMRGQLGDRPHPANDPCLSGLNSSPCREVEQWWELEYGEVAGKESQRPLRHHGTIELVERFGVAEGWAINPRSLEESVLVRISIDNPELVLTEATANTEIFDNGNRGPHGFSYLIPSQYLDGEIHQLYVKAVVAGQELELSGSPFSFRAYPRQEQGRVFFANNLNNLLIGNCGCHGSSLTYEYAWDRLSNPFPSEGGTGNNNILLQKAQGQVQHAGGNACQGNQTCDQITAWWNQEFGTN